jgi:archaellum component FlaF (FlaF/FlaG flagellin family)
MATVSEARTVYVGDRATFEEVAAAVDAWQKQTGDTTQVDVEEASDGYAGMGYAVDVFVRDPDAQLAATRRIADGIRPLLNGIPVATDSDLDEQIPAAPNQR